MFKTLDAWIIAQFERFCHWTQRSFGVTSSRWTRAALLASATYAVKESLTAPWALRGLLAVNILILFCNYIGEANRKPSVTSSVTTANPEKQFNWLRSLGLVAASFALITTAIPKNEFWFQFLVIAWYLRACDDLPPGESRVRQWLRSLSAATGLSPAKAEQ